MVFDLVFEGGGAKGMAFAGALQEFEGLGHEADRLLGTSAGAIVATLVAAGYTSAEMLAAMEEREAGKPVFVGFMGIPGPFTEREVAASVTMDLLRATDLPLVPELLEGRFDAALLSLLMKSEKYRHLFSFVERGGWYAADRFVSWLTAKLDSGEVAGRRRCFGAMTLEQFFGATGRELTVVAADTSGQQLLVLNHRTAPDCPVVWAARMSMSIPLVWQEVEWRAEWGRYRGRDVEGHAIVDGGALSNFPIELFVSREAHVTAVMGERRSANVLGLLIDESLPVKDAPRTAPAPSSSPSGLRLRTVERIRRLVDTITSAHDKEVIDSLSRLVVRLPAQGYGTTEFDMSEARRAALVKASREATKTHFAGLEIGLESVGAGLESPRVQDQATRLATRLLEASD
jgi:predicted acylesterase/phospholipase RssA